MGDLVFRVYEQYQLNREDDRRPHLGASLIGKECLRELWYTFRWVSRVHHEGRLLRLFERGNREEIWLADDIRASGVKLVTSDGGKQIQARIEGQPHFGGSVDGIGRNWPELPPDELALWECKTSGKKAFGQLVKKGVRSAKETHYAQMQIYMHALKLKNAVYTSVCKDNDEIHCEIVPYDESQVKVYLSVAKQVVNATTPPPKISKNADYYVCRFCDFSSVCHESNPHLIGRNCRTCVESTPEKSGGWSCAIDEKNLSVDEQKKGCPSHRIIPDILTGYSPVSYDEETRAVTYSSDEGELLVDNGSEIKCSTAKNAKSST